jgi:hypothetical protein
MQDNLTGFEREIEERFLAKNTTIRIYTFLISSWALMGLAIEGLKLYGITFHPVFVLGGIIPLLTWVLAFGVKKIENFQ